MVAETREQAQSAADALAVDYDVLPAVVGVLDAIKRDAPQRRADALIVLHARTRHVAR